MDEVICRERIGPGSVPRHPAVAGGTAPLGPGAGFVRRNHRDSYEPGNDHEPGRPEDSGVGEHWKGRGATEGVRLVRRHSTGGRWFDHGCEINGVPPMPLASDGRVSLICMGGLCPGAG